MSDNDAYLRAQRTALQTSETHQSELFRKMAAIEKGEDADDAAKQRRADEREARGEAAEQESSDDESIADQIDGCGEWLRRNVTDTQTWAAFSILLIVFAAFSVALQTEVDNAAEEYPFIVTLDNVVVWLFCFECVVNIAAHGAKPQHFFMGRPVPGPSGRVRRKEANACVWRTQGKWNCFDFLVSFVGLAMHFATNSGSTIGVLRLLRLLRVLTMMKKVPALMTIMEGFFAGMSSVSYIIFLQVGLVATALRSDRRRSPHSPSFPVPTALHHVHLRRHRVLRLWEKRPAALRVHLRGHAVPVPGVDARGVVGHHAVRAPPLLPPHTAHARSLAPQVQHVRLRRRHRRGRDPIREQHGRGLG